MFQPSPMINSWELFGENGYSDEEFELLYQRSVFLREFTCRTLSVEDTWSTLILHAITAHYCLPAARTLYGNVYNHDLPNFSLKHLVDVALLWYIAGDDMDWCYINKCAESWKQIESYQMMYRYLKEVFDISISNCPQSHCSSDTLQMLPYGIVMTLLRKITCEDVIRGHAISNICKYWRENSHPLGLIKSNKKYRNIVKGDSSFLNSTVTFLPEATSTILHIELEENSICSKQLFMHLYHMYEDIPFTESFCMEFSKMDNNSRAYNTFVYCYNDLQLMSLQSNTYIYSVKKVSDKICVTVYLPASLSQIGFEFVMTDNYNGYRETDLLHYYIYNG